MSYTCSPISTYTFRTAGQFRAVYQDGGAKVATLVLVASPEGREYSVLVGSHRATCSCPHFQNRLKGTPAEAAGCKHVSGALGHLIQERETQEPVGEVSPAIIEQIEEKETTVATRYYLRHVSGAFYGQDANGAFCSTQTPSEIYFWESRELAETNRRHQEECGFFYTVEEEQVDLPDETREIEDRQQERLARAERDRCLWD